MPAEYDRQKTLSNPNRSEGCLPGRQGPPISRIHAWMFSPVREKRQNLLPPKFITYSKRSNFENRTEWMESRASERNGPFGE